MTREEAIEVLKNHHMWTGEPQEINDVKTENEALYMATRSLEAWDEVIKFVSDRIKHWDAPCSGDEVVRNELASVMWEIIKHLKDEKKAVMR